jgi:predicted lipoprotein
MSESETQYLTPEQQRAAEALQRAAADYCNASPAAELANSEFSAAMNRGDATLTVEVTLPRGGIRLIADWPAAEIERREIVAFVPPPVHRA